MSDIKLSPIRRDILLAADQPNGVIEDRWTYNKDGESQLRYLSTQGCLDRRIADARSSFQYRIFATERGRRLLEGEKVPELTLEP